jgi:hypothetical protein
MKRLVLLSLLLVGSLSVFPQQDQSHTSVLWKVFCSGNCDGETFEIDDPKQDFIDIKQEGNRFYWGKDNVYTVYNKKERHDGFKSFTTYDFIDKYNQRGVLIYQYNRDSDWATKHMYYIFYEGIRMGRYFLSNNPEEK